MLHPESPGESAAPGPFPEVQSPKNSETSFFCRDKKLRARALSLVMPYITLGIPSLGTIFWDSFEVYADVASFIFSGCRFS